MLRLAWLSLLSATCLIGAVRAAEIPAAAGEDGFVPLFNGNDLAGWEGNTDLWTVKEGMIVGRSPGIRQNEFLATTDTFGDFELRLEFRLHGGEGNSGVQFRSRRVPHDKAVQG
ncbi:MAG: 3-keto-disaccharide hydrolase, partial [Planctomycetaceae bacterium]